MKFSQVSKYFEAIEQEASRNEMTVLLAKLFKEASPKEAQIIAYLSLGNLYPVYKGVQFNIAEKRLVEALARFFDVSLKTVQNWLKELGDLGLVFAEHAEVNDKQTDLDVLDVYKELDDIAFISGLGSQERKEVRLLSLLKKLDVLSAKFVIRIITGKLRLGFSDMTLLDAFSWMETGDKSIRKDLENAYNISVDVGLIIQILKESGIEAIRQIKIIPGIPIRPALAERLASAKDIFNKLGPCIVQSKLDGFRVQVHVFEENGKTQVKFFSRNLQEMSHMFPELKEAVAKLKHKPFIAEGEAMAYDQATGTFLPFQETVKRKRKHDIASVAQEYPLKLYLFDLLYLNGHSMFNVTHKERREKLVDLVGANESDPTAIVKVVEERKVNSAEELEKEFYANISAGLEGLVAKREDAKYIPGKRNFNWIKLKREESGHLDDTIDCVVLGYYSGYGKRASFGIGAFLVGVYNKDKDAFQTVAKIGTGLSDEEWKDLKKQCDKIKVDHKPKNVECHKDLYPAVWCYPEIVCAIRADEITLSPVHFAGKTESKNGYALRFPRFIEYRPDKSADDATDVKELDRLYEIQFAEKPKKKSPNRKKGADDLEQKSLF